MEPDTPGNSVCGTQCLQSYRLYQCCSNGGLQTADGPQLLGRIYNITWCVSHFVAMVTAYRGVVPYLAGLTVSIVTGLWSHVTSGQAVILAYHHKVVHRLRKGVRRKHQERWRRQDWLYHRDSAQQHAVMVTAATFWAPKKHCGPSPSSFTWSPPPPSR